MFQLPHSILYFRVCFATVHCAPPCPLCTKQNKSSQWVTMLPNGNMMVFAFRFIEQQTEPFVSLDDQAR